MKNILTVIILLCGFAIAGCTLKNGNNNPNTNQEPFENLEYVDDASNTARNIDRYLTAMETQGFSGAVIISEKDEVLLRKGYGYANRETRKQYTPETIQTSGSITKQFTAAAILLLESREELSVDDSLPQFFEAVPQDKQSIIIHQLLTHSSGLVGGIGADDDPIEKQDYLERVFSESLQFSPGSDYSYSNAGYSLLGMIVEEVSGNSFELFLRNELLLPSGIYNTGYVLPDWDPEDLAIGYRNGERWGVVHERGWIEDGPNWHLRANGGMHTTIDDMYNWLKTVQGRGILSADAATRWTTSQIPENYGYGWVVYDHDRWGRVITHSGSNRVFEADFVWLPEREFFIYIQGNSNMVPAASLSSNILAAAFDSTFVMPPLVQLDSLVNPGIAKKRAGIYHFEKGRLELTADDTRLISKLWGQSVLDLMLDHSEEQKKLFGQLNQRTRRAMDKIQAGYSDALSVMVGTNDDPMQFTEPFLRRIQKIGNLDSLHVIGTFANTPGSQFYDSGPWTTFVYAEFENWNQYWNLIWGEDTTYIENRSGPWPAFTLIPTDEYSYTGVRQGSDWKTTRIEFNKNNCLKIMQETACKEKQPTENATP